MSTSKPHIIFDYASNTPDTRTNLLRHIDHLQANYDNQAVIEVMAYGPGLNLLLSLVGKLPTQAQLLACRNTMQAREITTDALNPAATVVPSGLGHIIDRQLENWAYIKT